MQLDELERGQAELRAEIVEADAPAPVVRLRPRAAHLYRDKVATLEVSLGNLTTTGQKAAEALRALIDRLFDVGRGCARRASRRAVG